MNIPANDGDGGISLDQFADEDGNIRWIELMSVGLAAVIWGWLIGAIELIFTIGEGISTSLEDLGGWLASSISTIIGMPEDIVLDGVGGVGNLSRWVTESGQAIVSEVAVDWLEPFGPLAFPIGILWWGAIAVTMVWGLSKLDDAFRGDS